MPEEKEKLIPIRYDEIVQRYKDQGLVPPTEDEIKAFHSREIIHHDKLRRKRQDNLMSDIINRDIEKHNLELEKSKRQNERLERIREKRHIFEKLKLKHPE